jgi:hypothetical protein
MSWRSYCPRCKEECVFDRQSEICTDCLHYRSGELWQRSCTSDKLDILCLVQSVPRQDTTFDTLKLLYDQTVFEYQSDLLLFCNTCNQKTTHCELMGYCVPCDNFKDFNGFLYLATSDKLQYIWKRSSTKKLISKLDVYKYRHRN